MSKNVKEVASQLGVSPQYVRKLISKLPQSAQPIKIKGAWAFDEKSIKALSLLVSDNRNSSNSTQAQRENSSNSNPDKSFDVLAETIRNQNETIAQLTKNLNQSQQLQMLALKRVDELEKQLALPDVERETPPQDDNASGDAKEPNKKGFWAKLFKR